MFDRHGGWILDNFPNTRDQWNLCIEKNIVPDDVIVLKDSGESNFLMKRFYHMNKQDIDERIRVRIKEEEERKRRMEEERR